MNLYRDFRIKAYSVQHHVNQLVGLPWLINEFGTIRAYHFIKIGTRNMESGCQKYVWKRYRGYTLTIYLR